MFFFSTEVTSSKIHSDAPLYQRTRKAYEIASEKVFGNILEIGAGEGYGLRMLLDNCNIAYAMDKANYTSNSLTKDLPNVKIIKNKVPPIRKIEDNSLDFDIAFQVIEHIKDDVFFLKEIHRVLKKGGVLLLTTPNSEKILIRNPWHYREYNYTELKKLVTPIFKNTKVTGISGYKDVQKYFSENKKQVTNFLKINLLNIINIVPTWILKIPYGIANRYNRKKLYRIHKELIEKISKESYFEESVSTNTLDFFCVLEK